MSNTQKIQWKRLSVEAAAIVASILLAFAIDAWWDHRKDLIAEVEILHSLEDEFAANRETLLQDIEYVRTYSKAIQRLLVVYEGTSTSRQSVESIGVDLWHSMSWRTSNLSTATLDSVVGSGRLEIIRDQPLRAALAGWPARLDDLAEEEIYEWLEVTERYRPFVGQIIPIPSLAAWVRSSEGAERKSPDPDLLRHLLKSVEFGSLLSMRLDVSLVALDDKNDTLAELNRILDFLKDAS